MPTPWETRRRLHGPTGLTAAGREAIATKNRAHKLTRTHCKHGHAFAEHGAFRASANHGHGQRICRVCIAESKRKGRLRRAGIDPSAALACPSESLRSVLLKQAWERRRQKNGPTGLTPASRERMARRKRQTLAAQRWCRKGLHRWTPENTIQRTTGARTCRACAILQRQRSRRRPAPSQEKAAWKAAILAAHPDRGGSHEQAIAVLAQRCRADRQTPVPALTGQEAWVIERLANGPQLLRQLAVGWQLRQTLEGVVVSLTLCLRNVRYVVLRLARAGLARVRRVKAGGRYHLEAATA